MSVPRIYQDCFLSSDTNIDLDTRATHHLIQVLRLKAGDPLIIFNGKGGEFSATLIAIHKHHASVHLQHFQDRTVESSLHIHLGQGISRGEKMDFTIQKAVEMGVHAITPLFTTRCNVQLSGERLDKRTQHWQAIATSACEQSGRHYLPVIHRPMHLYDWLQQNLSLLKLILVPTATLSLFQCAKQHSSKQITLLIGSEGGFTAEEISLANTQGFLSTHLGPRILRTETAALAALTVLQTACGDFQ